MIKTIPELPNGVIGLEASGQVTATDYEDVVIPLVEETIKNMGKVSLLYHIGPDCTGFTAKAMWEDTRLGLSHLSAWKKVAVVTDIAWIRNTLGLFSFVIPGEMEIFNEAEMNKAREWVSA